MAFGFGFNKQKVLSAAEKCVQQGKLTNAISEYEKVLKHDPKDLTVMNTIGDLHSRQGDIEKAVECFKNVGDAYAAQGFTVKAIAMYKKLSKLKASVECVLRLAELYTQQGLFNDARAQYLQVAEEFLKTGQLEQAVRIFEKTLEMDPDNVAMRSKLAEVYVRLGKKQEAWQLLSAAAETLRAKGQLATAGDILQRMLKLQPDSSYALMLHGRAALEAGDATAAIASLSKVPDLDNNADGLRALFQANLRSQRFTEAGTLAGKLANVHDDAAAVVEYADALVAAQKYPDAIKVYTEHADRLLRNDSEKLMESLRSMIGSVREDPESLELVLALFLKGGEDAHLTEIYELLAHGYVQSEELGKAREYYLKLMQLEPDNQMHARNYQQVLEKLGTESGPQLITPEEGSMLVDELEATAPFIEQRYDDEVTLAVRAAMTDAELFTSYNMAEKALDPLLAALPKAPRDLRLNQKLAALHTRAGRFAEAGACCRTLESIYHDAGHAEEASKYAELASKYEQRTAAASGVRKPLPMTASEPVPAGTGDFEISAPAEFSVEADPSLETAAPAIPEAPIPAKKPRSGLFFHAMPAQPAKSIPAEAEVAIPAAHEAALSELDLSSEWEGDLGAPTPQPDLAESGVNAASAAFAASEFGIAPPAEEFQAEAISAPAHETEPVVEIEGEDVDAARLEEGIEEVRFYLGQGMADHAESALAKLEATSPPSPELVVLRHAIDSARQHASSGLRGEDIRIEEIETPAIPAAQPWPDRGPHRSDSQETISAGEASLSDDFSSQHQASRAAEEAEEAAAEPALVKPALGPGTLDEFVADLEASLGNDFPDSPAAAAKEPEVAAAEPPLQPVAAVEVSAPEVPALEIPAPKVAVVDTPSVEAQAVELEAPPLPAIAVPVGEAAFVEAAAAQHVESPLAMAATASAGGSAPAFAASLPVHLTTPAVVPPAAPVPQALTDLVEAAPKSEVPAGVDLSEMFGELKHQLEDGATASDEDPETHYNLGMAFREMGLLDEAVGEFQKVCQAADRGHKFPQLMQTYTWLAQCFLDKGVPEAAVRWYEKALGLPSLDQETKTALHYELASSFETAGNRPAALNNFMEVYSSNIDYRDVAERIKALRP
jgi:tetratricopeptide (TPR) repeat protein